MQVQPRSEFYVPIGGGCLSGAKLVHLLGIKTASEIFQQMNIVIGMYVRMYEVRMYAYMYVCVYTFVYVQYVYKFMNTCVYIGMYE